MLFNSSTFLLFLPVVLAGYYSLSRKYQNYWLLAASYIFYGYWDARFLSLIILSTIVDYFCALSIADSENPKRRKSLLVLSLVVNLGVLGIFRYCNFFVASAKALLGDIGFLASLPVLEIVLPVGISFYTFQTMAYTIGVYRRNTMATRDFPTFALFVSYFPQLVAGPIERADRLLPQLSTQRKITWQDIGWGLELILLGFLKKVGIADGLSYFIDLRFEHISLASGQDLLVVTYLFAIQIYCDFSGYSDIARGVSKLLGIDLIQNFRQPYLSSSITEFWRRWHISLSTWLRDYLYKPLGGNRGSSLATYRNLFLTMLLGGLWHGANWTFVVWGACHGVLLSVERLFRRWPLAESANGGLVRVGRMFLTFHLVILLWIPFRASGIGEAWAYIVRIFEWAPASPVLAELSPYDLKIWVLVLTMLFLDLYQQKKGDDAFLQDTHWAMKGTVYASFLALVFIFGNVDGQKVFIYFQF